MLYLCRLKYMDVVKSVKKNGFSWRLFRLVLLKLVLCLFLLSVLWVLLYRWVAPPFTLHMLTRRAEAPLTAKSPAFIQYEFAEIEEISPYVPLAMIAAEDQLFLAHNGFDYTAIQKAFQRNLKDRKKIIGGSTISQQVAKNVFLWHGRSYIRKGVEAYFTVLIELLWSKKRIMEVYLNIAEMGDRVFGVEAAAQRYFRKSAKDLNREEAALLAAVLPNPIKFKVSSPSAGVRKKQNRIVRNMRRLGGTKYIAPLLGEPVK